MEVEVDAACLIKSRFLRSFLESFAIIYYMFIYFASVFVSIAFCAISIWIPILWPIVILYSIWLFFDWRVEERGGRIWPSIRQFRLFNYAASYFSLKLVKTADLPPNKNYIICSHPHGVINFGTFIAFGTEAVKFSSLFPGISTYLVTLPVQFIFPIRREYMIGGGLISSSRKSLESVLGDSDKANALILAPGGAEEALEAHPDLYNVVLARRRGFIRLALQYGADLVPCYHFGEQKVFKQWPNPRGSSVRKWQSLFKNSIGATMPLFYGKSLFSEKGIGWMPFRKPITSVVGPPVSVKRNPNPSEAEVNALHAEYCKALKTLFDENKLKYDDMATEMTELKIL